MARAALLLLLWVGFWALAAGLVAGLLAIPMMQARHGGVGPGGLLAFAAAVGLAWALRPRWLRWGRPRPRSPLTRTQAPSLHALAEGVARRLGVPPPQEIVLGTEVHAAISWAPGFLRRRRILELGLPLFLVLSDEELAAVIAHELGHERGGDVALARWTWRTRASLASVLEELGSSAVWLDLPFRAYAWLFFRATARISRAQERAADVCAVEVAGRVAAWGMLRKIHGHGDAWAVYHRLVVRPLVERGLRAPLAEGFQRFLDEPRRSAEVTAALAAAAARPPSPHDSHPPERERLAAVDPARPPATRLPRARGCELLLGGAAAVEDAWYARATTDRLAPVGWDQVAARAALPEIGEALAGTPLEWNRISLAELPALVERAGPLWQSMQRNVNFLSPLARVRAGHRALVRALALSLAARGFAPELRPGAALELRRGEVALVPEEIVADLAAGRLTAAAYLERLATWEESLAAPARTA